MPRKEARASRPLTGPIIGLGVLAAALTGVLLAGGNQEPGLPCSASGDNACELEPRPCAEAEPGDSAARRNDLPYGFNDAAPLVGQLTIAEDLRFHEIAGSSFIRVALDWGAVERTPGRFDFARSDEIYCAASKKGLATLFHVTGIPLWAVPVDGKPCSRAAACVQPPAAERLDALTEFAAIAAARYPAALGFEAWNEPNLPIFWPDPDPAAYVEVLGSIYKGVKAGAPETPVLAGSVSNQEADDPTSGALALDTFLEGMVRAGGAEFVDALSIHLYPIGSLGSAQDRFTPQLAAARPFASALDVPIWVTETGVTTESGAFSPPVSEEVQAAELMRIYELLESVPEVEYVGFHTLLDPNAAVLGGPGFGWFATQGPTSARPKPVVCEFRELSGLEGCPESVALE